jgi:hypothetical protein
MPALVCQAIDSTLHLLDVSVFGKRFLVVMELPF